MEALLVAFAAILGSGAIGWAAWVTKMLLEILVSVRGMVVTAENHEERIESLEKMFPRTIQPTS